MLDLHDKTARNKHSSLFCPAVSLKEKSFHQTNYELIMLIILEGVLYH